MKSDGRNRRWLAPYIGSLVIVILLAVSASVTIAVNPGSCISCHSDSPVIKASVKTWRNSDHSKITCAACHIDKGARGLVDANFWHFLRVLKPGARTVSSVSEDSSWRRVSTNSCRRCHSPETRKFTFRRGLNMNHTPHLKNGIACSTCHNLVAHPDGGAGQRIESANRLNMVEGCWRCHGMKAEQQDSKLRATLPAGADPPTACTTCHNEKWDLKPSSGAINHQDENGIPWRVGTLRHGKTAREVGFNICFGCHDRQKWCGDQCHNGIAMPHDSTKDGRVFAKSGEPNWRGVHFKVADQKGKDKCALCHDPVWRQKRNPDFCMTCHHKSFYETNPDLGGPWVKVSMPYVKQNGAAKCFECHQPEFCVTCHITGSKPPPGKFFLSSSATKP